MNATRNVITVVGIGLLCSTWAWAQESDKANVWSNLDVQFYGYVKADAVWSDSAVSTTNYVKWADLDASGEDDTFGLTARETRFGFKITGPELEGWKSRGQLEVDFFGGTTENKGELYMRHGYLALENPEKQLTVLAGQTWDVVSPLNPRTLNYSVLWWIGNIGYRRPQLRVEKGIDLGENSKLLTQLALARTIGTAGGTFADDPGADSGLPQLQGRMALTFPCGEGKPMTVGVSGHFGREEHDYDNSDGSVDVDTWSGNLDLTLPLASKLVVKGELHTGSNLSAYLGGIGQGVENAGTTTAQAIRSSGGWVAAALGPWNDTTLNLGYGMEKLCDRDVAAGERTSNRCAFGNAIHSINQYVDVGTELSYTRTEYKGQGDADVFRAQWSLIFKI